MTVPEGSYVCVSVTDDGTGMDEETRRQMFDPFFTTKGPGKGTGLGLATCWGIVKKAGGQIVAESEPGEGTTVLVHLPGVDAEVTDEPRQPGARTTGGDERIIVAEDNEAVREFVARELRDVGYSVLEACDGQEAVELCEVSPPNTIDLLLTDVVMPRMNGPELVEEVVPWHPEMKVLYISGYNDDTIMDIGVVERGVTILEKPFSPETLAQKVREVLDANPTRKPEGE
jgi:CheY-like chemotaxis protein